LREIILITASISYSIIYILPLALITFLTGVYTLNIYGNTQHGAISNFSSPTPIRTNSQHLILLTHLIPAIVIIINPAPYEKSKSLGSGGSMVARLKLKGIDGRAPPGVEPAA